MAGGGLFGPYLDQVGVPFERSQHLGPLLFWRVTRGNPDGPSFQENFAGRQVACALEQSGQVDPSFVKSPSVRQELD